MHRRWTEVRRALGRAADVVAQPLELAAPDVGEILAVGTRRGALVEEDRDAELAADALTELARERDAVLHRRSLERDEGDDVGRAHAGMLAGVARQIYLVYGFSDSSEGRIGHHADVGDEGDDAAVVARVRARVQQIGSGDGGDGVADGGDHLGAAPLGEV